MRCTVAPPVKLIFMSWKRMLWVLTLAIAVAAPIAGQDERARDEQILRDAEIKVEGPALLEFLRQMTPTEDQRRQILDLIRQCGDRSFSVRRNAAERLRGIGLPAVGLLRQSLQHEDPEVAKACERILAAVEKVPAGALTAAAARMLGRLKPAGTTEVVLAQIPMAGDEEVGDALRRALAQVAVENGQPNAKLVAALNDSTPARRAAAGVALIAGGATSSLPQARQLLADADSTVRLRVALTLVAVVKDKQAVAPVIDSLAAAPPGLAWHAEELLHRIADGEGPKVSLIGDETQREKCRKSWADWWSRNSQTVKLERLDATPRQLGYTLVLQTALHGDEGRAIEFAPDGKTIRWQIGGLQLPVDAQVLPRTDRVLIAEYNAHRITERDFQGRITWKKDVSEPMACQRLSDGNTFIAHRNGLLEVNAKDEQVFRLDRNMEDIVAGQKARDGTYFFLTRPGQLIRVNAQAQNLKTILTGQPYSFGALELLANNRVLVTQLNSVAEYDLTTSKQEWRAAVRSPTSVFRTADGRTLATGSLMRKIVEIDRDGNLIKEFTLPDGGTPWRVKRR
jgi:HEAT repeat protein